MELYIKAIILLMAEYKTNERIDSTGLVMLLLEVTDEPNRPKTFNDEENIISKLKQMINSIISGDTKPDENIMVSLELILNERQSFLSIIDKYVLKRKTDNVIELMKAEINAAINKIKATKLLSYSIARIHSNNANINDVLENLIEEAVKIKELRKSTGLNMVIDEINFDETSSVINAASKAHELVGGGSAYKLGWECLNRMTQGGFRRGEFVTVTALKHNYKSGFLKSVFLQTLRLNKPEVNTPGKKPMLLFISVEEEVDNIMFFFYTYLKYTLDNIEIKEDDIKKMDSSDIAKYVMDNVNTMGFHLRVLRINPDQLDFRVLFDIVEKYEKDGFELIAAYLDYVKKMSRNGCRNTGPQGTDLLDLFSKLRNYFSSKSITFVTPHQLNTAANNLIKTGMPGIEFVKHIADKSYYADSSQLGQEIDLELFMHIVKINKEPYLAISRGKHRIATVIPEEDKFALLKFTSKISPIPEDNELHSPCSEVTAESNDFDF